MSPAQVTAPAATNPYAYLPAVPSFELSSETVAGGRPLPIAQWSKLFGVPGGEDVSPQLSWSGFPAGTKSFVVSMPTSWNIKGLISWFIWRLTNRSAFNLANHFLALAWKFRFAVASR